MSSDSQPTSIQEACGQHQHVEPLPDRGAHQEENLEVLVRLNGQWAERAMSTHHTSEWSLDSSESPVHRQQGGKALP